MQNQLLPVCHRPIELLIHFCGRVAFVTATVFLFSCDNMRLLVHNYPSASLILLIKYYVGFSAGRAEVVTTQEFGDYTAVLIIVCSDQRDS